MPDNFISTFIDFLGNQPKTEETREFFRKRLRDRLEKRLEGAVDRTWELPVMAVKLPTLKEGEPLPVAGEGAYAVLLLEARQLYVDGHFYGCVAMCGIVGERLVKDLLRASVLVESAGNTHRPDDDAFNQLERVETSGITRFLNKAGLLSDASAKAAKALGELRNDYAHARGKDAPADARKAILLLDELVGGTVSVLPKLGVVAAAPAPAPGGGPTEVQ